MSSATTMRPRPPTTTRQRAPSLAEQLGRAIEALRSEDIEAAEPLLNAILQQWPAEPNAQHFLGVLHHTQGRVDESVALIRQSLATLPTNAGAWNNLGNVLLTAGRVDEASSAYEQGIAVAGEQNPAAVKALINLATVYRQQSRMADAEASCRRALALQPESGDAWYGLSLTLMAQGRVHDGLIANSRAVALWPRHLQARDQVIRALLLLGERDRAAELYREWLAEEPDNPVVQHQLAACLGEQAPARASDAYVEVVFDAFAASFDAKLEKLHYRAPELVAGAMQAHLGEPTATLDIADLGCGTGLVGQHVRPWARHLAGCDLSAGMLLQAKQRGLYQVLHKAELVHYLVTQPERFDVVLSADTLCYFGDLHAAMAGAACALRPGGWLSYTVEALPETEPGPELRLNANGRYAHARSHVLASLQAAGLAAVDVSEVSLRMEAGCSVQGWLVVARKPQSEAV
ncbi:MAG: tetratricopeptide repeat protein [Vitreoscilla sp.]|nr:tetratricopeptide repeat protein [Vitreoscilla sp.]